MEVACCDADHEGAWEGEWEECEVVADHGDTCDVRIVQGGELCTGGDHLPNPNPNPSPNPSPNPNPNPNPNPSPNPSPNPHSGEPHEIAKFDALHDRLGADRWRVAQPTKPRTKVHPLGRATSP